MVNGHLNNGTRWLVNMVVKVCSKSPAEESGTQVDGDTRKPGDRQGGQDDKKLSRLLLSRKSE